MAKSTIESIEGMDVVNIGDVPTDKLKDMVEYLNRTIEKAKKERGAILEELTRRV